MCSQYGQLSARACAVRVLQVELLFDRFWMHLNVYPAQMAYFVERILIMLWGDLPHLRSRLVMGRLRREGHIKPNPRQTLLSVSIPDDQSE